MRKVPYRRFMVPRMPDSHFLDVAARLRRIVDGVGTIPIQRRQFIEELISQYELDLPRRY